MQRWLVRAGRTQQVVGCAPRLRYFHLFTDDLLQSEEQASTSAPSRLKAFPGTSSAPVSTNPAVHKSARWIDLRLMEVTDANSGADSDSEELFAPAPLTPSPRFGRKASNVVVPPTTALYLCSPEVALEMHFETCAEKRAWFSDLTACIKLLRAESDPSISLDPPFGPGPTVSVKALLTTREPTASPLNTPRLSQSQFRSIPPSPVAAKSAASTPRSDRKLSLPVEEGLGPIASNKQRSYSINAVDDYIPDSLFNSF